MDISDNMSVEDCQTAVLANDDCMGSVDSATAKIMYGNGSMCRCVDDGEVCDAASSNVSHNNVYKYQDSSTGAPSSVSK